MSEASFDELIKKPAKGNHIYRGKSKAFDLVCAGLLREYPYPEYDIEAYQRVALESTTARQNIPEITRLGEKYNATQASLDQAWDDWAELS